MKKVVLILGLLLTSNVFMISCREETNDAGEEIENATEEVGEGVEDATEDVEEEF